MKTDIDIREKLTPLNNEERRRIIFEWVKTNVITLRQFDSLIYFTNRPLRYKCVTCGNTCLQNVRPDNSRCGGCNKDENLTPNWKLLKFQEAYQINGEDKDCILGEI